MDPARELLPTEPFAGDEHVAAIDEVRLIARPNAMRSWMISSIRVRLKWTARTPRRWPLSSSSGVPKVIVGVRVIGERYTFCTNVPDLPSV
jgi:hypothetical protein